MRRWNGIRSSILFAWIAVLAALAPGVAAAETFKVTTPADVVDTKGCTVDHCTLREAVWRAGPNDRVDVPAGTYLLERGELFLTSDTIRGEGARSTIIDGAGKSRVLWVTGTTTVAGVTIRGGNGAGRQPSDDGDGILLDIGLLSIPIAGGLFETSSLGSGRVGGGIFVRSGVLDLVGSTVTSNTAHTGGGIGATGDVRLTGSTVVGNTAGDDRPVGRGGGIAVDLGGFVALRNSTVSHNDATGRYSLGGGVYSAGSLLASNATLADNGAEEGGGLFVVALKGASLSLRNSIIAAGTGKACGGPGLEAITSDHNIVGDDSCGLDGEGNQVDDARLLGLDDYGGPTNTRGLHPRSPAIDAGVRCEATDQRGVARPQPVAGMCDVGAFEYRAPTLTVVTRVVNNHGGMAAPDDLGVHVRLGKEDVEGSPRPGSDQGSTYTLDAYETYTVAADPPSGYDVAVAGDCSPSGNIGLIEGHNRTCTITATDQPATLRVVTDVVNDDGGTLTAGGVVVRVRRGSTEVASDEGSAAGVDFSLRAGSYVVSADAVEGYAFAYSGECAPTLGVGETATCTVTADDDAATLRVITNVVNDDGGTLTAGDVITRVSDGTAEVARDEGSAAGVDFSLRAGSYVVSADAVEGYAFAYSGGCAPTLEAGETATCTITADDDPPPPVTINRGVQDQPPPPPPPPDDEQQQLPPPVPGKNVNAELKSGNVKVKLPGKKRFVPLEEGQQLPVGTVVDARKGHVTLIAAANKKGDTSEAEFWAGIFKIGQTRGKKPITTLTLKEKLSCPKPGKATIAAKRKKRRLWGSGKGRFRTKGSYSSATVRGTKWLTEDRCRSTRTRVVKGKVSVRDFVRKKTVIVKRGKKYVARARR